ncbi:MAG: HNH endonuclease [Candidatus Gastranaerophilales bacterium]|nr:HNH endonuclease [Candidatus Gastranaerophilales bacterium]
MEIIEQIHNRLEEFVSSDDLRNDFTSTAVEKNKRVYPLFNTNTKTLNTYCTYLSDVFNNPNGDHHQKIRILKKLRVYYAASDNISEEEKKHILARQQILKKCLSRFENPSSFVKSFVIFLLSLNSAFNPHKSSQEIFDTLDDELKDDYDSYLSDILLYSDIDLANPIFGIYVLYSDKTLLDLYLDLYKQDRQAFLSNIKIFNDNQDVKKRIANCQKSALRSEALLFSLYTLIDSINVNDNYENIINDIINKLQIKLNKLKYTKIERLLHFEDNCFIKLREFLLDLSESEKEEIMLSIGKGENSTSSIAIKKSNNLSKNLKSVAKISNERGYDVLRTTKSRRGQNIFKRNLVNMLDENEHKCAICGCNVSGDQYLIASHIYPWKYSNDEQKTDGNNGLLLCPNHDFLFDSLLISFDEEGKILISEELSQENCEAFCLKEELYINISSQKETYMNKHRQAFKNKGWEK